MVVLAVNAWNEPKKTLARFVRKGKLKQIVLLEGRNVAKKDYGVTAVPTTLWIDRDGVVIHTQIDFDGPEELNELTKQLIGTKATR